MLSAASAIIIMAINVSPLLTESNAVEEMGYHEVTQPLNRIASPLILKKREAVPRIGNNLAREDLALQSAE